MTSKELAKMTPRQIQQRIDYHKKMARYYSGARGATEHKKDARKLESILIEIVGKTPLISHNFPPHLRKGRQI